MSGGCALAVVPELLTAVALCWGACALGHAGFRNCSAWAQQWWSVGSRDRHTGLDAQWHVESFRIMD